jgi:hypothetical protein
MSDFLTRLAGRALGLVPLVQPVTTPRYAPDPDTSFEQESEIPGRPGTRSSASPTSGATTRGSLVRDQDAHHVEAPRPEREADAPATGGGPEASDTAVDLGMTELHERRGSERPLTRTPAEEPQPSPTDMSHPPGTPDQTSGRSRSTAESSPPATREGHEAPPESGVRPAAALPTPLAPEASRQQARPAEAPPVPIGHEVRREGSRSVDRIAHDGRQLSRGAENRGLPVERSSDAYAAIGRTGAPLTTRSHHERPEPASQSARESTGASTRTEPTIRVSIGRIDVRAVSPPASPPRRTKQPAPKMSLDDYLRARNGGTL